MAVICVFSAIRFDFGPDYQSYWNIYEHIKGVSLDGYAGVGAGAEKGFLYFLQLFPNYTSFIVFNSVVWIIANYYFLSRYADYRYYWLLLLFIFFDSNYLLLNLVAMRSAMSAYLFIVAFLFLVNGKRLVYVLLILLAGQIHTTSLALLALVVLTNKKRSILFSTWCLVAVGALGFFAKLTGYNPVVAGVADFLMGNVSSFESYGESEDVVVGVVNSSFNSILFYLMLCAIGTFLVFSAKKETETKYIYVYKVAIIAAFVLMMFGQGMIGDRFMMFFNPLYYVAIIHSIKQNKSVINVLVISFLLIISVYMFASKMSRPYMFSFWHYETVFDNNYIP